MTSILLKDCGQTSKLIQVTSIRLVARPALLTSGLPHTTNPQFHQVADELHAWFLATVGPCYCEEVSVTSPYGNWIAFTFKRPQIATLFKLRWGGK